MFARFDENPAMTLRVIKETKRYGRTHGHTDGRTDGQRENSIPPTNKVCGGYNNVSQKVYSCICLFMKLLCGLLRSFTCYVQLMSHFNTIFI